MKNLIDSASVCSYESDLHEDLLTIIEAHSEDISVEILLYRIIKYMTTALYECTSHKEALIILRLAMDDAIREHVKKKEG